MHSRSAFTGLNYEEIILPSLWGQDTYINRTGGSDILGQMYAFNDKADRPICLIPEVTAIIQELVQENYFQNKYPKRLFYVQRCYRYENVQSGRYREFTQLGVEIVTNRGDASKYSAEAQEVLVKCLEALGVEYTMDSSAKRGLSYYTELGFEASCENLGAQKQIAGGGVYKEGCGFAIGLDRVLLSIEKNKEKV